MRVLLLTHRLPYAANRGDRIRALHLLRSLSRYAEVDLVSVVHSRDEESHAADLIGIAATVSVARIDRLGGYWRALAALPTPGALTHAVLGSRHLPAICERIVRDRRPDLVLSYCSGMAHLALEPALVGIPLVLDLVDVDSEKWRTLGSTAARPQRWIYATEARRLRAFEARVSRHARAVLVVNDRERLALLDIEPTANVSVVPLGIAVDEYAPSGPPSEEPRVTFCGVMDYHPNVEAALWLAHRVWPAVRARIPAARLSLVGSDPSASVQRLAADPSIEVTGTVPDVRPYLWRSAVAVAPLFVARGTQNKVLEALAAGLPCVVTPAVLEGLPPEAIGACAVATDSEAFAAAIVDLLEMPAAERARIVARSDLGALSWPERLAPLQGILLRALHAS